MNLQKVSNQDLLTRAERLAKSERHFNSTLLYHIGEIDRRRLFSDLKFESLHEYMIKKLKYSDDEASRRIAAARLLNEIPEIASKVADGKLNVTTINLARTMFNRERKAGRAFTTKKKRQFLQSIENMSTREAAREVAKISPQAAKPDLVRPLSEGLYEMRITISTQGLESIEELKSMLAHSAPGISVGDLFAQLCGDEIARIKKTAAPRMDPTDASEEAISYAEVLRQVKHRDGGRCTNCGSNYAVEVDHIHPKAMGGLDTIDNLRLLCRRCNQREAIKSFGQEKMDKHINAKSKKH